MTTTRRALTALTATALIVAASIAFPGGAVADPGDEFTVSMQLLQFEPADVSVTTGTTVIFKNDEVFDYTVIRGAHQIVADDGSFDTGVIPAGGAWSMEVLEPTSTTFTCVIHPALMTGSLEVTGEPIVPDDLTKTVKIVEPDPNDSNSWTFKPADIEIAAGTTVTWRNEGAIVHTVTAEDGTFDSGNLAPGESFTFTFDDEIALNYFCEPHPWMTGTVAVGGVTPPPPPSGGGSGGGGSQGPIEIPQPTASGDGPTTYNAEIREPDIGNPQSWTFLPPELTVREGDSVIWTNKGSIVHTVTANDGSFDSGDMDPNATFELTFDEVGTIEYKCTPHPWMVGTVVVQEASAPAPAQPTNELPETPVAGGGTGGEAEEPGGEHGAPLESEEVAAQRRALTWGMMALLVALGAAMIVPNIVGRKPSDADGPGDGERAAEPERDLIGAGV